MAEVRAFPGVRYGRAVAHELGRLLAPPYDVTRPDLVARLHERGPYNMVHLEHVRPDPGDDPHALAATRYRRWLRDSILVRDASPAFYRYDHTFTIDGQTLTRRGLFAVVRLAAWAERIVLPHEDTFPAPVQERLRRLRAVQANLSPLYLLVRDQSGDVRALLDAPDEARPVVDAIDPDGERHSLTALSAPATIRRFQEVFAEGRLYVADGHHRYDAALAYRDERRAAIRDDPGRSAAGPGAHEYVLAFISDVDDPGVVILPTHRLVRSVPGLDPAEVRRALARLFDLEEVPLAGDAQPAQRSEAAARQPETICVARFAGEPGCWRLRSKPNAPHAAVLPSDRSPAWRALPSAILEHVVLGHVLGLDGDRRTEHVTHTHDAALALAAVERGEAQLALLVPPSTVADVIAVADAGDRMPAKSTYFSPKVPAGLVIHDLTEGVTGVTGVPA